MGLVGKDKDKEVNLILIAIKGAHRINEMKSGEEDVVE